MKRILIFCAALLLSLALCVPSLAAVDPVVCYNGGNELVYTDANGQGITGNGDFGTAFSAMLPGVEYTQRILLQNTSQSDTVRFYMNLSVLETLQNARLDGAGYSVRLYTDETELFSAVNVTVSGALIGGASSAGELADLNDALTSADKTGFLVATVAPGESVLLTLSIAADATMSNAYQAASGTLEFTFFAELDTAGRIETIYVPGQVIITNVKTGQTALIYIAAGVLVAAVLVLVLTDRKKSAKKHDDC